MTEKLKLWELINPSDPYTFYAPSIEVAGACVALLSTSFGAFEVGNDSNKTPTLFGWNEWLEEKGVNDEWVTENLIDIADAFDSFLIGDAAKRADVESMLSMLPEDKKQQWKDDRQDRRRTSMNQIGEAAYSYAKRFRERAAGGSK